MATKNAQIMDFLTAKINNTVLWGNSELGDREFCSDLINSYVSRSEDWETLAEGTGLHISTLRRMATLKEAESGADYDPMHSTMGRIFVFFGVQARLERVKIKKQFQNQPKHR